MAAGSDATVALRRGLRHDDPRVRVGCCVVLDHYLDDAAVPELVANLEHEDAEVRAWAMHALVCDNCKEGQCRPAEDETLPLALKALFNDPSPSVRLHAIRLLFKSVFGRDDIAQALERTRDHDPSPKVRKAAALRAPGGIMYLRASPERPRLAKSNARAHLSVR
jgi:HEAT repeat protein